MVAGNKDWIYRSDDWLLARRMEQIISMRNSFDMAEIILMEFDQIMERVITLVPLSRPVLTPLPVTK